METKVYINNVPEYACNNKNPYWVVRVADNELYFYCAYIDVSKAYSAMLEIDKTHENTFIVKYDADVA